MPSTRATSVCAACGFCVGAQTSQLLPRDVCHRDYRLHRHVRQVRHVVFGLDDACGALQRRLGITHLASDRAGRSDGLGKDARGTGPNRSWRSGPAPKSRRARRGRAWRPTCDPQPPRRHPMAGSAYGGFGGGISITLRTPGTAKRSRRVETRDLPADDRRPCNHGGEHPGDLDVRAVNRLAGHIRGRRRAAAAAYRGGELRDAAGARPPSSARHLLLAGLERQLSEAEGTATSGDG